MFGCSKPGFEQIFVSHLKCRPQFWDRNFEPHFIKVMEDNNFVSRGGIKLKAALVQFDIDVKDKIVLDIGSSVGGFVDCLLKNGAAKVYAVDTAYGKLDWKLRNDPRVVVRERTNILYFKALPELVDLITIDTSWTKLELVLTVVKKFLKPKGIIIGLLKPQYEAKNKLLRKGIIPPGLVEPIKNEATEKIKGLGFSVEGVIESPILGAGGNKEFFLKITAP